MYSNIHSNMFCNSKSTEKNLYLLSIPVYQITTLNGLKQHSFIMSYFLWLITGVRKGVIYGQVGTECHEPRSLWSSILFARVPKIIK